MSRSSPATPSAGEAELRVLLGRIANQAGRFADLARRARQPDAAVPGSEWTARDVVAHVALLTAAYVRYLEGDATPLVDVSDIPGGSLRASNAAALAAEPERDLATLAERIGRQMQTFVTRAAGRDLEERVVWHGRSERLRAVLAVLLGELVVHGLDLARAVSAPWPIARGDALAVLTDVGDVLPLLVDHRATGAMTATVDVRLRGGPALGFVFDRGALSVCRGPVGRADVHVSADPAAFLLVAYGRRSQWSAIATGRLVAWGRKPWIALKLTRYLVSP